MCVVQYHGRVTALGRTADDSCGPSAPNSVRKAPPPTRCQSFCARVHRGPRDLVQSVTVRGSPLLSAGEGGRRVVSQGSQ